MFVSLAVDLFVPLTISPSTACHINKFGPQMHHKQRVLIQRHQKRQSRVECLAQFISTFCPRDGGVMSSRFGRAAAARLAEPISVTA